MVEVSFFLAGQQRQAFLDAVAACALPTMAAGNNSPQRIAELSKKYKKLHPDYAGQALIDLAERTELTAILTLDVHHFSLSGLTQNCLS